MRWNGRLFAVAGCLALMAGPASAQRYLPGPGAPGYCEPPRYVPPLNCPLPGAPTPTPIPKEGEPAPAPAPVPADAFAQAPEAGTQPAASYNPNVFGDLIGLNTTRVIFLPANVTGGARPVQARVPVVSRTAFKIAENESARPQDRAWVTYNFFSDVNRSINGPQVPNGDLHREAVGFEKAFLDGGASFGMRFPFAQLEGDRSFESSQFGDMSLVFKYAFLNDRQTGNVLSSGLVLTLPTGQDVQVDGASALHSTVFQPFLGYVFNFKDLYVQGFTSLAVPTDERDITLLFNDVGVGYWLLRRNDSSRGLTGVVPTVEVHVNTPLSHRGSQSTPFGFPDEVNMTGGAYFICPRATLGVAIGVPVTGPRTYTVEAITTLNVRF